MDDFEKMLAESEREGIKMSQGISRILRDMWVSACEELHRATKTAKALRIVSIIASALAAVCLCFCVWAMSELHDQAGEIAAIHRILDAGIVIEETTTTQTTTTQTIEGDTATINNGTFEQYNDSARNGGGE